MLQIRAIDARVEIIHTEGQAGSPRHFQRSGAGRMLSLMLAACQIFVLIPGCRTGKPIDEQSRSTPLAAPVVNPVEASRNPAAAPEGPSGVALGDTPKVSAQETAPAKPKPPMDTRSAKPRGTVSSSQPRATQAARSDVSSAPPTLDLADMERRLRDTHAIGVFTKLSLKNQVDDLLGEFRLFHQGSGKFTSTDLRQHYDALLLKVVALLRDGDPPLASAITSSREAIWSILVDPVRFSKL